MDTNLADFADSLKQMAQDISAKTQEGVRQAVMTFRDKVVARTPVRTGRARAGWILTADCGSDEVPPPGDHTGDDPTGQDVPLAQGYYQVQNNLDYISDLEDGTAKTMGRAMVALSLAEFEADLDQAIQNQGLEDL